MALSNVSWKGMKALEVMANTLPSKLGGKKLRSAYKFALAPTKAQMLSNIPADKTGKLKHSIDTTVAGNELKEMYAIIGPRRRKNTWNMQGWHSHLVEKGTKPHKITAGRGKMMPVFTKAGFTGKFAKTIHHSGSAGTAPFQKAIDSNWSTVSIRVSDKVAQIMREEITNINQRYGNVVTRNDL